MLKGKTAVVTGGAKGIGKSIVEILAKNGANVLIDYCSSGSEAQQLEKELCEKGYSVQSIQANVCQPEEAEKLIRQAIEIFGGIDILVNNAGKGLAPASITDIKYDELDSVLNVNFKGTFYCSVEAAKYMAEHGGGKIISISSSGVKQPRGGTAAYAASKSAVELLMRSIAHEFGEKGVAANTVAPGPTETEMLEDFFTEERKKEVEASIPMKRIGCPEDVAKVVLFFASELSDYVTGQTLLVDGGRTIR
ncbi:MAG TPA: beta-ketoacyl-ACP reductase [Eubacteriaceae bacterium]|nr:beta-ketoacyl-ACP reductase [Eubacteriaceae bacterium]